MMILNSLKYKTYLKILFTFLSLFLVFSYITYQQIETLIVDGRQHEIQNELQIRVGELDSYFTNKLAKLRTLQYSRSIIDFMDDVPRNFDKSTYKPYTETMRYMNDLAEQDRDIKAFALASDVSDKYMDHKGFVSADDYYLNERASYIASKNMQASEFIDPWIDTDDGQLHVTMREPMFSDNRTYLGFVAVDLGIDLIIEKVQSLRVTADSYAFAYNKEGLILIHDDESLINEATLATMDQQGFQNINEHVSTLTSEESGNLITEVNGDDHYIFFSTLPMTKWKLAVVVPKSTILAPVEDVRQSMVYIIVISGIFISIVLLIIAGGIANPIKNLVGRFKELSEGDGDLSVRLNIKRNDEIGSLGKWFNLFIEKLSKILQGVIQGVVQIREQMLHINQQSMTVNNNVESQNKLVEDIHRSIEEIDRQITEVTESSTLNSSAVEEVASTIGELVSSLDMEAQNLDEMNEQVIRMSSTLEEITATSNSIADRMTNVADSSKGNTALADEGLSQIGILTRDMEKITSLIGLNAGRINELNDQVNKIDEIVTVIDEVAGQTNLLALNAAIEAAQAGEAGRGFSIVADEIKKLADRTANATGEITKRIRNIQESSNVVVEAVQEEVEKAENSKKIAEESGGKFKQISESIQALNQYIQEGSQAVSEQHSGIEDLMTAFRKIESISTVINDQAQEQSSGSNQIVAAIDHMSRVSHEVAESIEHQKRESSDIKKSVDQLKDISNNNRDFIANLSSSIDSTESKFEELVEKVNQFQFEN